MIKRAVARLFGMSVAGFARALTGVLPAWQGCLPDARQERRVVVIHQRRHVAKAVVDHVGLWRELRV